MPVGVTPASDSATTRASARGPIFTIVVHDAAHPDQAISGAWVALVPADAGPGTHRVLGNRTRSDGKTTFYSVDPGLRDVDVNSLGYDPHRIRVTLRPDCSQSLKVYLARSDSTAAAAATASTRAHAEFSPCAPPA